eukprot:Gregarina_sp_Poly_1__9879@NODE_641_length_6995_cov_166_214059_g490_i0_p2_GENE_NODE_641_length_6995_cov_166_214059_g490_i0NODE_641_length_6995_cov_166_214059_g490_i0_p2_ORF_typecomplete_len481_score65_36NPL4/PF05021_15/4e54zfNPL4/PF05020_15/6_3e13UN_NPL4/PF11543_8/9_8e07ubiquitin/PF00240_23/0_0073Ubiquitin_2/PF14560_6/0_024EFhand_like/PF09279_11/1_7e03EFhand_like/PF09279_11/3_9e02EFhand_like/PF09279_11/2_3_NODE_641_length_6995_cov_166_214059_g490_i0281470
MSFIVRVSGSVGRCRLCFTPDTTLGEVKKACSEKFSVPTNEVALSLNKNGTQILIGDAKKLKDLHLPQGVQLFMHSQTQPVMVPTSQSPSFLQKGPKSFSGGANLTADNVSSAPRQKTCKKKKSKHKFKPFESYLDSTDYQIISLPLMNDYRSVVKNAAGATKLPPTISLKHQLYRHIDHLEVMNVAELSGFVTHWRNDLDMLQQRAAYLIGYYREDRHYENMGMRAVVEAIYEPPQVSGGDAVRVLDDPFLPTVEAVARALGLEIIGWTFTHLPRSRLVTASEVVTMGKMQLARLHRNVHYTGYPVSTFVTMTISPKDELNGEPAPDAFMISDLGLAMIRDNILCESGEATDDSLILRQPNKNELMPTILEQAQGTSKLDTDWLLIRVVDSAPKEVRSIFKRTSFPRMGRSELTLKDLRVFLNEATAGLKAHEQYTDFHFLLFVAKVLGLDSALAICDAIAAEGTLDAGFEELLKSLDA